MNISDLMTQDGFSSFLQAYHHRLHAERSFPPLGVQKALHTASPIFGYKNWQAMGASVNWNASQTLDQSVSPISLVVEFRNNHKPFSDKKGAIREVLSTIFATEKEACKYLFDFLNEDPPIHLQGRNGEERLFVDTRPTSISLEQWAEYLEFHLHATVQINRLPLDTAFTSEKATWITYRFTVNYVGDHQSPFSETLTFEGEEEEVYMDLIDLIANDLGAMGVITKSMNDFYNEKFDGKPIEEYHPVTESPLFLYLINAMEDANKTGVVLALRRSIGDGVFNKEEFVDFYEAAASVELTSIEFNGIEVIAPSASLVADHVIEMQDKYGFKNDENSVREAVEESANLLNIRLREEDIVQACDLVLNKQ